MNNLSDPRGLLSRLPKNLRLNRERLGALMFLLLTLIYGSQIPKIQQLPVDQFEAMNARTLPWTLFVAGLLGASLLWFFNPQAKPRQPKATPGAVQIDDRRGADLLSAAALLVWTGVLSWLLGVLGFGPAVFVFLLGGFWLLGERRIATAGLTALLTAVLLTLILRYGLTLYLPAGSLWTAVQSGAVTHV